ncbi:MAG TPA: hypothetical protein VN428_19400 [Bryobacteraceae bacterium]|nr:hypothetical protein [Bryobacteraceae bacterium]
MKTEGKRNDRISAAVAELREAAGKDLATAWNERLRAVLYDEVDRILRARIAELRPRLEEAVQFDVGWRLAAELDAASAAAGERERRALGEHWNRSVRRLLRYENEASWAAALADAAKPFAQDVVVFLVRGGVLEGAGLSVPVEKAPAFRNALESRDTVIAMRTAGELSDEIAAARGASRKLRCCVFPVVAADRVPAVLYADGESVDVNALEAITAIAGVAIAARAKPDPLAGIAAAAPQAAAGAPPLVDDSPETLRARQFARVRVAEIMLHRNGAVRAGRERRDLYSALEKEIDTAREAYARTFALPDDYLHSELVRTLANGDAATLGEGYPGPLPSGVQSQSV